MNKNIRSRKYTSAAKDQSCINCGKNDGTVVLAHYQGFRGHAYGKGTGMKPHDICGADLCHDCHAKIDSYQMIDDDLLEYKYLRDVAHSELFLHLCMLTMIRRHRQGKLEI